MKGLIIKDFLVLKSQAKVISLMLMFYLIYSFFTNNMSMLSTMVILISVMMPINTMAYDEKSNWDKYALAASVSRKDMVFSKYLFALICVFSGTILIVALNMVVAFVSGKMELFEALGMPFLVAVVGIVFLSFVLPLLFKFGVEKGRMLMMVAFAVPFGIGMLITSLDLGISIETLTKLVPYLLPPLAIIILLCSASLSLKIYNRKEF